MTFPVQVTVKSSASGGPIPGATVTFRLNNSRAGADGIASFFYSDSDLGTLGLVGASAPGYDTSNTSVSFPSGGGPVTAIITLSPSASATTFVVLVRDANTHQPISGAQIFSGGSAALPTDATGYAQITVPSVPSSLTVTAAGYTGITQSVTRGQPVFDLQSSQPGNIQIQVVITPPSPGAAVVVGSESLTAGPDSTVTTSNKYAPGSPVSVSVTQPGFNVLSTNVSVVSGTVIYTVGPLVRASADSDAGAPSSAVPGSPLADTSIGSIVPLSLVRQPDAYEYVYPSSEYGKYFTTTQARMYIGNIFVDELHTVQFVLQANRIPIYGYASRDFDDVALGRALVQGQIFVNFISEGYLYTIVKEHAKLARDTRNDSNPNAPAQQQFDDLRKTHEFLQTAKLQLPGNTPSQGSNPDGSPVNLATTDTRLQLVEQKMGQLAALGPAVIDSGRFFQPQATVYANATYLPLPFDIVIEMEGAGRVVKRRLEKCYLGSNEQVMDQSGEVLGETYSFLARRLR